MRFKRLELENIEELRRYFERNTCRLCDCTIGGTFMWRDYFETEYEIEDHILYLKVNYFDDGVAFPPPRGEHQGEPYEKLIAHCLAEGLPVRLCAVSRPNLDMILSRYPDARFRTDRAWSDYLYLAQDLKTLAGRRYSAQRNHIHRFERENPDWSFELIDSGNLEETKAYFAHSFEERQKDSPTYNEGNAKTFEVLNNMEAYGFVGGVLRSGGRIVGASLGEVQGDTLFAHIERADVAISGVYQKLTNMFSNAFAGDEIVYINREEDDGDEGLRKAKLAYHPHQLLDKYFVEL